MDGNLILVFIIVVVGIVIAGFTILSALNDLS